MKPLLFILFSGLFLSVSCSDYIASKRDGLKPYDADHETREAQEDESNK